MITGIVLAGGQSQRMGRPKALLTARGATFLERCIESLERGGCGNVLVVDHPLVAAETVAALVRVYLESGAPIVRAIHEGKPGHPVLFSRACFPDLLEGDTAEGARSVVRRYRNASRDVEVSDRGVLADIDTPADFAEYFGEGP
jgi:CTP:molybdopterin cytidylyltransferase MocA